MEIKIGDLLYYARILPSVGIHELIELKVRSIGEDWFVGCDIKSHAAYIFNNKDLECIVFTERRSALLLVKNSNIQNNN